MNVLQTKLQEYHVGPCSGSEEVKSAVTTGQDNIGSDNSLTNDAPVASVTEPTCINSEVALGV